MNKPVKQKLCWNCEGSVAKTLENCPYCGVYLNPEADGAVEEDKILEESKPQEDAIPAPPYSIAREETLPLPPRTDSVLGFSQAVLPLLLLSAGAVALIFALLLFFFSTDGKLTLEWDADYWSYFALVALPLLFFGWRALEKQD